jgi:DNA polymerase III delta subunit
MLIYIFGNDSYRIKEKLNEYIIRFQKKFENSFNLEKFDLSQNDSFTKMKIFLSSSPMFSIERFGIIENISKFKEEEQLLEFLKEMKISDSKQDFLFFVDIFEKEKKTKNNDKLKKYISKNAKYKYEINNFKNISEARNWINEKFKENESRINSEAINILFKNFGENTWQLSKEIEKLSLFKPNQEIQKKDILEVCNLKIDMYIFSIFDSFFKRDKKNSIFLFKQAIKSGVEESMIFNLLVDQIRTASYIVLNREKELGGINQYKLKKIKEKLPNFSKEKMINIFNSLSDIDDGVKNGRLNYSTAIERLLLI